MLEGILRNEKERFVPVEKLARATKMMQYFPADIPRIPEHSRGAGGVKGDQMVAATRSRPLTPPRDLGTSFLLSGECHFRCSQRTRYWSCEASCICGLTLLSLPLPGLCKIQSAANLRRCSPLPPAGVGTCTKTLKRFLVVKPACWT